MPFEDRASGSHGDRAGLGKALAFIRPGDCLVVWKLDRLGRSLPHLLTTVTGLKERGVAFRLLAEQIDTTTPQGSGDEILRDGEWAGDWIAAEASAERPSTFVQPAQGS